MDSSHERTGNIRPEEVGSQLARQANAISSPDDAQRAADRAEHLFERLKRNIPNPLRVLWNDIKLLIGFVRDSAAGRYRHAPWRSIAVAAGALVYFANPFDLLPDFLPIIGYLDDAAIIALALKLIHDDLQTYQAWRDIPPVELVEVVSTTHGGSVNLFLHGYKAVRSEEQAMAMLDAIVRCALPGRSMLLLWPAGDWSLAQVLAYPFRPLHAAARLAINEFSDFHLAQVRAESLGRHMASILDRRPELADASINLIGHSLGCHILHHALADAGLGRYRIHDGYCVSGVTRMDQPDWATCLTRIEGKLHNLYNPADWIVGLPELWSGKCIGRRPLQVAGAEGKVVNIQHDVGHCSCWSNLPDLLRKAHEPS